MAGGPGAGYIDDARLAEALRAGDAKALTDIYDSYAPGLYEYCHALLRDRGEAAGALLDSLLAADAHSGRLQDPRRLRGWLYALARNECMRRRDDPDHVPGRDGEGGEATEVMDGADAAEFSDTALASDVAVAGAMSPAESGLAGAGPDDVGLDAYERTKREEQRLIAHSALARLTGRQREAIDLSVRHELEAEDLAGVLGMTPQDAGALLGKARGDLGEAIAAVLVARTWPDECPSVTALVDGWPLHTETCRKLVRHVATCPTCGERDTPRVSASRLLDALPVVPLPVELRVNLIALAIEAGWAEHRQLVARTTDSFDEYGWPIPWATHAGPPEERGSGPRRGTVVLAALAGVVVLAVIAATAMALTGQDGGDVSAKGPGGSTGVDPSSSEVPSTDPPTSARPSTKTPSTSASPHPTLSESPAAPRATVQPLPGSPAQPSVGRLAVSGCSMDTGDRSCTVSVRAVGGPVRWQVTGTSGGVRAGGGGTLNTGQSAGVTVRRSRCLLGGGEGSVSFSPGGTAGVSWTCP